jgi:hypothetical protein
MLKRRWQQVLLMVVAILVVLTVTIATDNVLMIFTIGIPIAFFSWLSTRESRKK